MSIRMLTIETRRNTGLWVFPIVATVAAKFAYDALQAPAVPVWAVSSTEVRDSLFVIGPFAAAVAAWVAGREGRQGLADLLATTPRPELQRRLMAGGATALWAILAYLAVGALVIADSALHQAWGAPVLWPMLTGLLAVLAHTSLGYALGYSLRSRFTAPLVGIVIFAVQSFMADQIGWGQWLSPIARLETSVWYGVRPYLGLAQTLFMFGLVGLAWATVALGSGYRRSGGGALVSAALLIVASLGETYRNRFVYERNSQGRLVSIERDSPSPYTPVCRSARVPVCVHPAYQSQLPALTTLLNRMMEPLLDIPGAPTRAAQQPFPASPDVFAFDLRNRIGSLTAYGFALQLVRADELPTHDPGTAQTVLQVWLMERAGVAITCMDEGTTHSEFVTFVYERPICAAAQRFAALDPATRREWLSQHYADLRADKLRLEDLP